MFAIWFTRTAMLVFWIMDILNMPFMEMFDTTYPLNGWFWLLVFVLVGGSGVKINIEK